MMYQDFGGYEIIKKIGVGGMATVYTARQKSLNRTVVLKTMHEHLQEDKTFVARFEREAKAAATMSHENIVQIIDYGQAEEMWYIAMEYVGGWDLKKWIEKNGSPPVEVATLILYDLCAGLHHAHEHHIIHRDIKPANIMLAPTGVPKIADFGLAKQTQESTVLTVHDAMIGTVPYMSPEHATGQHVDERSDIFSLGVVAYELFGGRRPFPGNSSASVINAIITVDPLPLENLNPLVTVELQHIVSKMLHKDPEKRYQSAHQVRRDLELIIDDMKITRGRDLIAEYLTDPEKVTESLHGKQLKDHLNRAFQFKAMGLGRIDDAIREFERARYLDPENTEVTRNLEELKAQKPGGLSKEHRAAEAKKTAVRWRSIALVSASAAVVLFAVSWFLLGLWQGTPPPEARVAGTAPRPAAAAAANSSAWSETETPEPAGTGEERSPAVPDNPSPDERKAETETLLGTTMAEGPPVETGVKEEPATKKNGPAAEPPVIENERPAEVPAPKLEPRRETTAPEPAIVNGTLEVRAIPSATIVVNGRTVAEDVSVVSLTYPPGEYLVVLDNPFYGTKEWTGVAVATDETMKLQHDFTEQAKGSWITVTTNRIPAEIYIDGVPTEKWTPQRKLPITPGWHRITVKKDGFAVAEGIVEAAIRDGNTVELAFTLSAD
ncbi:MAG: protein kinase [Candidatus Eisenbacteria bacterium]